MKRFLHLALLAFLLCWGMGVRAVQKTYTAYNFKASLSYKSSDCPITVTFAAIGNNQKPSYKESSTKDYVQFLQNNTLTFSAPAGVKITYIKIAITNSSSTINITPATCTASVGEISPGIWEYAAGTNELVITKNSGSQTQVHDIIITYEEYADPQLSYSSPSVDILAGDEYDLPTLSNPLNLSPITYSSSNEDVAAVDGSGAVSIVGEGSATITASFPGGVIGTTEYASADVSYTLTYTKRDHGLAFNPTSVTAMLGEDFTPPTLSNPNNLPVRFTTSHPSVATVDAVTGEITLVAAGVATITATFPGNDIYKKANGVIYTLTVEDPNSLTATYDFTSQGYGLTNITNSNQYQDGSPLLESGEVDLVIEGKYRWWKGEELRVNYASTKCTFAFSVPNGFTITKIVFAGANQFAVDNVSIGQTWTGNQQNVTVTCTATSNITIRTINVTYMVDPVTIADARATADASHVAIALEEAEVLDAYTDSDDCYHAFIREGTDANQAVEVVVPTATADTKKVVKAGSKVSGTLAGVHYTSTHAVETAARYTFPLVASVSTGNTFNPVTLESDATLADYTGQYVVLKDQEVSVDGDVVTIGGTTVNDVLGARSAMPYNGAYGDAYGILSQASEIQLLPKNTTVTVMGEQFTNQCFYYVFDENRTLTLPSDGEASNYISVPARIKRTFYSGWNTLCLPFQATDAYFARAFGEGYKALSFKGMEKDSEANALLFKFEPATTINATSPLLLNIAADVENPEFRAKLQTITTTNVEKTQTIDDNSYTIDYVGVLAPTPITAGDGTILFLGSSGTELVTPSVSNDLKSTRCYFHLSFDIIAADQAGANMPSIVFEDETTGIGHHVLRPATDTADSYYTLDGRRLYEMPTQKGIYIVNGKKMVVK